MTKPTERHNRLLLILMMAMMAIVGIGVVTMWSWIAAGPRDPGYRSAVSIGGPFSLVDQTGAPVTDQTYAGHYRLIYFGYTFCPDACPTELQVMAQAVDSLGPQATKVQPIFVTIDPARDTPEQLAAYVPQFDKRLVGLTGSPAQIAQIAREYKVYYAKSDAGADPAAYAMNHSSYVYLMDPDGKFLTVFSSDADADKMALAIRQYMAHA
jgi:cytochrome oxidase Cu insertion factor (SCO1/SenC/PrrC family)